MTTFGQRQYLPETVLKSGRPTGFELGVRTNDNYTPLMTHVCNFIQQFTTQVITANSLQAMFPDKHYINRQGFVGYNVSASGHTGGLYNTAIINGRSVTGETMFSSLKGLFDAFHGCGAFQGDRGYSIINDTPVALGNLELRWYCLDIPSTSDFPGEGLYVIEPPASGGFTFSRSHTRQLYTYQLSFFVTGIATVSDTELREFADAKAAMNAAKDILDFGDLSKLWGTFWMYQAFNFWQSEREKEDIWKGAMKFKSWEQDAPSGIDVNDVKNQMKSFDSMFRGF